MPRTRVYPPGDIPPPSGSGVLLLIHPNPLISLYSVDIPTTPPTKFRVTAYPKIDDTSGIATASSPRRRSGRSTTPTRSAHTSRCVGRCALEI